MGVHPIPPLPQKKDRASMYSEGEKVDPKRRLKLLIRVIFLIVVVVVLFAPVWEIVVGVAKYEVVDESYFKETHSGVNYTYIYILIEDLGYGGVYHMEFHAQNVTEEITTIILEPRERGSFRATVRGAHIDSVSYTIYPPDVRVSKSLFQILIGL